MKSIDLSIKKILLSPLRDNFIKSFDDEFPSNKSIGTIITKQSNELVVSSQKLLQDEDQDLDQDLDQDGGYNNRLPMYNINNYNYNRTYQPNPNLSGIIKKPDERDLSKIAYSIIIDMELQSGTSLSPDKISELKCTSKYNAIRKAYADFMGKPYIIKPVYPESDKNKENNSQKTQKRELKGGSRKTRKQKINRSQKI
jgi:hypothetical protein